MASTTVTAPNGSPIATATTAAIASGTASSNAPATARSSVTIGCVVTGPGPALA